MSSKNRILALLFVGMSAGSAVAAAPVGRYSVTAETVTDQRTRLTWQRAAAPGTYTQAQAGGYCAALALAGGGWRLPTLAELQSIMDVTSARPSIDANAFPGTPGEPFWSSTPRASDPASGWGLDFGYGMSGLFTSSSAQRVRCVR